MPEREVDLFVIGAGSGGVRAARIAAGAFAAIILLLARETPLPEAVAHVKMLLVRYPGHAETLAALTRAEACAANGLARAEALQELGEGWNADEALSIAKVCGAKRLRH